MARSANPRRSTSPSRGPTLTDLALAKLRQRDTYAVTLIVGTAINLYGQVFVPWVRGHERPLDHFAQELARAPGVMLLSVSIAYCFPLVVGLYSAVAARRATATQDQELRRLASFPERNPNPVIEVDLGCRITYVNPKARARFPDLEQVGSAHPLLLGLPGIVKKLRKAGRPAFVRETEVEGRVYLQSLVHVPEAGLVRLYTADITKQKRAERGLARLASFPENNPNPVIEVDLEGNVTYQNPLARERFPDLAHVGKAHALLVGIDEVIDVIKKTRESHDREVRHRDFIYRQKVVYVPEGALIRLYIHDVTTLRELQARIQRNLAELEQAHQELADAQVQLVDSEKRAALSQLVAGIAHEINTPIGAIRSMHDTLNRAAEKLVRFVDGQFAAESKERRQLDALARVVTDAGKIIATASQRIATIVERMKNFARLDEAEFKSVNINESIDSTLQLVSHDIHGRIEVLRDLGELPSLNCFPGRLNQSFLTVILNAIQAIDGTGHLWVETRSEEDALVVRVRDDGVGIAPEHMGLIFDAGFTTKGVGVGTGLGLSICRRTVHDHGGEISVESEVGEGTTVTIRLPRTGAAPPPPSATGPASVRRNDQG